MKIPCAALAGVFWFVSLVDAGEPAIAFSGVMTAGGNTRIALTDTATKATAWVQPGDDFKGHTVAGYDAKAETVTLKKSGQETRLRLISSKAPDVSGSNAAANAAVVDTMIAAVRGNLRQLAAAARQYQLERGVSSAGFSDLVGPDKLIKELKPVAGENYSTLNFGPNVTAVSVTTASGATVTLDLPPTSGAASNASSVPTPLPTPAPNPQGGAAPVIPSLGAPATAATPLPAATALPVTPPALPVYTIQTGDTWQRISAATGVPIQQLRQLNPGLLDGSPLPPGQTIRTR